ncbi:MAG TPA: sialate O-acetylesterase [Flavitalea sp.]|nr:sialate O-acetylesterase [Flavitalea sp.]
MKRLPFLLLFLLPISVISQLRLARVFGDSMVLQRDRPIPVWGWAEKNEKVTVQFNGKTKSTKADASGKWLVTLDPMAYGGPYQLTAKGKSAILLKDVLIGDVWICSGQSNMEWPVSATNNATEEIAKANYPLIRHIQVIKDVAGQPRAELRQPASWQSANPSSVGGFTAVGYYFARELFEETKIPIGLLNTSWGGTDVETWTSRQAFERDPEFKEMIAAVPNVDLDSMAKVKSEAMKQKLVSLQGALPAGPAIASNWSGTTVQDEQWPKMDLPGVWEESGLDELDGFVWFRRSITIPAADAGKPAKIHLSMIDDQDETWINGQKIGHTESYNTKRIYDIPAALLKDGDNKISIRVHDTGGGGGVYGDAKDLVLQVGDHSYPLDGKWSFQVEAMNDVVTSMNPNSYPSLLYNAMVNPLIPFAIKGVIWYQGESNAGRAYQYRQAFPLMINDWRSRWKQGDFPFYFVQLASFNPQGGNVIKGSDWAELREAQLLTLRLPNTGMAVTTDIGESNDIHPRNKQDVGKRLAAIALHNDYNKAMEFSGPVYKSMKVEGNKIILQFEHVGKGLEARDKYGYLKGFAIAGNEQKFTYAKAYIEGNKVVVYSDAISDPAAVRYSWENDAADSNLFNKDGFPAGPFRTDDWKGITVGTKYSK